MTIAPARTIDAPAAIMLGVLGCLWGGTYLFVGVAVREVGPLTLVLTRLVIAAMILHGVRAAAGVAISPALWPRLAVMAVLNNVIPFCLIFWAQTRIPVGLASILNAATPVFGVIVAHLARQEALTPNRVLGVLAGFAGVAVLIGPSALAGAGDLPAEAACLAAAVSYAFSGAYARRTLGGIAPLALAAGQLTASALIVAPLALVVEAPWTLPPPSPPVLAAVAALSVFSTALAYILFFRILARAGATNLLLVTFLIPIVAVLLGAVLLGEALLARHVAGFALVAAGLAAIDGRLLRRVPGLTRR
jgi:drug/metabolite transporter (DMT)-like permease